MIRLRGITWEHARGFDCLEAAAKDYAGRTAEVCVDWEYRSLQAFADEPLDRLADNYDLLVIDHPHIPAASRAAILAPFDGAGWDDQLAVLAAESVGRSYESYAHDGHQWGLASDAAAQVSMHRPDLIADPPVTWDGVLELAREGRVLWPAKPIDAFSSLISIAGAHGGVPAATSEAFLEPEVFGFVLDVMHHLAESVPAENLAQNPIEVSEALAASDRACFVPLLFGYSNYARAGYRAHRLRYRDVPSGPAGISGALLGGAGIAVSARSRYVDAARAFAVWVAGREAQCGVYFDAGGQPGNAAAWDDDRINAETDDFFRGTRTTLEQAYLRPRSEGYLKFQETMAPMIRAALRREITDDDLQKKLADSAAELIWGASTGTGQ